MRETRLYASMTIPVLLFLFSFFNRNNDMLVVPEELHGNVTEEAAYMEVPDYIYSAEYRMILEKTYIDLFDKEITSAMRDEGIRWLGYCHEDSVMNDSSNNRTKIKIGDKVQWNGDTFCLPW
jgi:hypothetical protein